jgi:nitrate reductase NapE component
MSDGMIAILVIYGFGLIIWPILAVNAREEAILDGARRPGCANYPVASRRLRAASLALMGSPLWPFLAVLLLGRLLGLAIRALSALASETFGGDL